jgi:hypothetical protein
MPSSMGNAHPADAGLGDAKARGYETRDANTGAVLGFLALLFLILAATLLGVWLLFRYFDVAERQPIPGSSFAGVRQVPLGPELQVNPHEDLLKTYDEQQQLLENYSWEDRNSGAVRLPIERAMDLLVQKGLPVLSSTEESEEAPDASVAVQLNGVAGTPGKTSQKSSKGNR